MNLFALKRRAGFPPNGRRRTLCAATSNASNAFEVGIIATGFAIWGILALAGLLPLMPVMAQESDARSVTVPMPGERPSSHGGNDSQGGRTDAPDWSQAGGSNGNGAGTLGNGNGGLGEEVNPNLAGRNPSWPLLNQELLLIIAAGPSGGELYQTAGMLCEIFTQLAEKHALRCLVQASQGSRENLDLLIQDRVDLALVQSDVQFLAQHRLGAYESVEAVDKLRRLATLYSIPLTLLASQLSGIFELSDIRNKRLGLAPPESFQRLLAELVLKRAGLGENRRISVEGQDLKAQIEALCRGQIDALITPLLHPSQLVADVIRDCGAKLISLENRAFSSLFEDNNYLSPLTIDQSLYGGVSNPIASLGVSISLIGSKELRAELVSDMVALIDSSSSGLRVRLPFLREINARTMKTRADVLELHQGARNYYDGIED